MFTTFFIYVSHQLTRFAKMHTLATVGVIFFLGAVFLTTIVMFNHMAGPKEVAGAEQRDNLFRVGMYLLAYINFIITFVMLRDLVGFFDRFFQASKYAERLYSAPAAYILLALPVIAIFFGYLVVALGPAVKKIEISSTKLPTEFEGLRIVHLTDIHVGATMPKKYLEKVVTKTNQLGADIVVLTGDILDNFPEFYPEDLKVLGQLKASKGIFVVHGNHEYYWNFESNRKAFQELGFTLLENEVTALNQGTAQLQIAGVTDPAAAQFNLERPDLKKIEAQYQNHSFKILLAHQPFIAPEAAKIGTDLQLSGHTHGGQFFPWNFLIVFFQKYIKGHYQIDNMQLYVNQGTGYWGPSLRLGTYSEITEIILRKN